MIARGLISLLFLNLKKCRILRSNQYTLPDISDHDYLTVSYQVKSKRVKIQHKFIYDYGNVDNVKLSHCFANINFDCIYSSDNINFMFQSFYESLYYVHNICVPMKRIVAWINLKITSSMLLRDRAFAKFKMTANLNYFCSYRVERNRVNDLIRSVKHKYYFENSNQTMKTIWNNINSIGIGNGIGLKFQLT